MRSWASTGNSQFTIHASPPQTSSKKVMTLGEVGFLNARGYSKPENSVPGLAQDLIYNLQPLQVGSVLQNRCNLEFPQAFPRSLPPQFHQTSLLNKVVLFLSYGQWFPRLSFLGLEATGGLESKQ